MFRIALTFNRHLFSTWSVTKCYHVRKEALPYTLPVKVNTDHGRKRLMLLSPWYFQPKTLLSPIYIVNQQLLATPEHEKRRRAAEMETA